MSAPIQRLLVLCLASLLTGVASAGDTGVWQKHELRFNYVGFTTIYSCDGLADKLKLLLIQAGARPDAKVRAGGCAELSGRPDKMANASLVFYTLAPTGNGDAVPGQWRKVSFANGHPRELQTGDCELVEQFREVVVKKAFTTRNLEDSTTCVPHQASGSRVGLKFEALVAAP